MEIWRPDSRQRPRPIYNMLGVWNCYSWPGERRSKLQILKKVLYKSDIDRHTGLCTVFDHKPRVNRDDASTSARKFVPVHTWRMLKCLCLRRTRKPAFMVVKCGRKVRSAWALEMLTSSSSTVLCWSAKPRSIACTSEKPISGTERRDQVTDITVWQRWVRYQKKKTRWVGLEGRGKEQMRERGVDGCVRLWRQGGSRIRQADDKTRSEREASRDTSYS